MRKTLPLLLTSLALAAVPAQAAPRLDPDQKLARALEGRVAGEPVDCISLRDIRSSTVIKGRGILYEVAGGTVYFNRTDNEAQGIDDDDVLVTDTHSSRLCSIDVVRTYDPHIRTLTGIIHLSEFVPYRRPGRGR